MDYYLEELADPSLSKLLKWLCACAMIFGGAVPYIPQYREIKRTEDAEGFSLYVCLTLLIANTLRILFWFGRKYELPLLIQSIVMNITMFVMIHLCVNVRNRNQIIRGKDRVFGASTSHNRDGEVENEPSRSRPQISSHTFTDFDRQYFWAWTDFISYLDFMILFSIISSVIMYLLLDVSLFVELVGFLSVFTEALLGVPQLIRNHQNKTTEGMSVKMVLMWTVGDTFKSGYFVIREAPSQFWLCGLLQVCVDIFILLQVYWYRHSVGIRSRKQNIPD